MVASTFHRIASCHLEGLGDGAIAETSSLRPPARPLGAQLTPLAARLTPLAARLTACPPA